MRTLVPSAERLGPSPLLGGEPSRAGLQDTPEGPGWWKIPKVCKANLWAGFSHGLREEMLGLGPRTSIPAFSCSNQIATPSVLEVSCLALHPPGASTLAIRLMGKERICTCMLTFSGTFYMRKKVLIGIVVHVYDFLKNF